MIAKGEEMEGYKLVRDRIPDIIHKNGETCKILYLVTDQEYEEALLEKFHEEVTEYQLDRTLEELADILEVISAIAELKHSSLEEINQIRLQKVLNRGGFEKRIMLKLE